MNLLGKLWFGFVQLYLLINLLGWPVVFLVLLLGGCAWDQYTAAIPTSQITTAHDPAFFAMRKCDQLGFTIGGEGHRLCILREIDRLRIERGTGYAPIQILPHAFPSLVPPGTITVVPSR